MRILYISRIHDMHMATRPFNFNLPDTLRDFMEFNCARNFNTMSKYLIDLINYDMAQTFEREGQSLGIEELYEKRPDSVDSAIRFAISHFDKFLRSERIVSNERLYVYPTLYKRVLTALEARKDTASGTGRTKPFTSIIAHPALNKLSKHLADRFGLKLIENDMDIMKSHILLLSGKHVMVFSVFNSDLNKKAHGDDDPYFFDQKMIDAYTPPDYKTENKAASETSLPLRVREVHLSDNTKKFFIQEDCGRHTKPSLMNANPDGTVSIFYAEDWQDRKEFSTLEEAKKHLKELRREKPEVLKEIIHE